MAKLDKSQGITFVYTDLYELYKKTKNTKSAKLDDIAVFKRCGVSKSLREFPHPMGVKEALGKKQEIRREFQRSVDPLASLKHNLSGLSDAHARLRYLLEELDDLTKKSSLSVLRTSALRISFLRASVLSAFNFKLYRIGLWHPKGQHTIGIIACCLFKV